MKLDLPPGQAENQHANIPATAPSSVVQASPAPAPAVSPVPAASPSQLHKPISFKAMAVLAALAGAPGCGGEVTSTGSLPDGTGGDLICESGEQPTPASIPRGASGIPFLAVNCKSSGDVVAFNSLKSHRFGDGDGGAFSNIYLYEGDNRLTAGQQVNPETQGVEFPNLNLAVDSQGVALTVVGDIADEAAQGSQNGFEIPGSDAIGSNAGSVKGDFPIRGNLMAVSGALAGKVYIVRNGSLDNLSSGQTGRVAQFEILAGDSEAMAFEDIALAVRGSCASAGITGLKLYDGAVLLAETPGVEASGLAPFVLQNPYLIQQGNGKIFWVEANATCNNNENIKIYLDQEADLHVTGTTFGTGAQVDNTAYDGEDPDGVPGTADDEYSYVVVK